MEDVEILEEAQARVWEDEPSGFFAKRGLTHSTVSRFGLGYTGDLSPFDVVDVSRSLVLPYEDGLGNLRGLRYRPLRPDYDGPKYLSPGTTQHLFAVRAADNPIVYIAEGEIDTMILWQLGYRAVGLPGASAFRPSWRYIFRPPHVERVKLVLDPDAAGLKAAKRLYEFIADVSDVTVVSLPKGMDVNDTFLKYGPETLREALESG